MGNMKDLLSMRDQLLKDQQNIFMTSVKNINMRYAEIIKNDFGKTLVKNCARDAAGEVVRRYFDTSDYYITVDQMYERIVHFSYDDKNDPLAQSEESIRKNLYNMNDAAGFSSTLNAITKQNQDAQEKLFLKESYTDKNGKTKTRYVDHDLMEKGKNAYREEKKDSDGILHDELTGNSSLDERLEVDHVQAAATARYNSRYINSPEAIEALKEFYNSSDNFQMLEKRANGSKGDVRVYADGNRILSSDEIKAKKAAIKTQLKDEYMKAGIDEKEANAKATKVAEDEILHKYDITYKADAEQVANAVCERWENAGSEETRNELKRTGKLDANGKVPPDVRKKLEADLKKSMNKESEIYLKILLTDGRGQVLKDSWRMTETGLTKIVAGQVIYYALPPVLFETQRILKKKNMTIKHFFEELKQSEKRIMSYITGHLGDIFKNIMEGGIKKFIKVFFDILIDAIKETVKRLVKIAKELVLSLVQCVKIIASKDSTPASKANSIMMILSTTVTSVALEVLFEYLEKQFSLPDILMEPLQVIVTIIATNLVMLALQEADLFDVRYGFLVENINAAFDEERKAYEAQSNELYIQAKIGMEACLDEIQSELRTIRSNIAAFSFYDDDVTIILNKLNDIYEMGIDFDAAWNTFRMGVEV